MESGKLRYLITIKQAIPGSIPDAYGQYPPSWTDVVTLHASANPLTGREYYAAVAAQSEVEIKFGTRYVNTIKDGMRVYWNNEPYTIISVVNVESLNRELQILAKKVI